MVHKVFLSDQDSHVAEALLRGFEILALPVMVGDILDLTRQEALPSIVINTSLFAQSKSSASSLDNTAKIFDFCATHDVALIHLSSHQVFGVAQYGLVGGEKDEPDPDTTFGLHLLTAEQQVLRLPRSVVLRLPWLLDGPQQILDRFCWALVYSEACSVCEDWRGSPVYTDDVSRLIVAMVQQIFCGAENWGCFHLHASDYCSEAELADHIARIIKKLGYITNKINLVSREQRFIEANGWLKGQRCNNNFGFQFRTWNQGLKRRVEHWLNQEVKSGRLVTTDNR